MIVYTYKACTNSINLRIFFLRNHPLFTKHNNCKELLSGNNTVASDFISRRIAKDMEQVNDMVTGDNWTVIDECCDNDMNEIYKDKKVSTQFSN